MEEEKFAFKAKNIKDLFKIFFIKFHVEDYEHSIVHLNFQYSLRLEHQNRSKKCFQQTHWVFLCKKNCLNILGTVLKFGEKAYFCLKHYADTIFCSYFREIKPLWKLLELKIQNRLFRTPKCVIYVSVNL